MWIQEEKIEKQQQEKCKEIGDYCNFIINVQVNLKNLHVFLPLSNFFFNEIFF